MVTGTLAASACVRVISLGLAKVKAISIQPKNYTYKELFTKEIAESLLEELKREQGLKLEDVKVLSVEKEKRVVQEANPSAVIEVPLTVHRKVLDEIRIKLWDKGEGIAVRFEVNRHLPSSKLNADNDYFVIIKEEKKSRSLN